MSTVEKQKMYEEIVAEAQEELKSGLHPDEDSYLHGKYEQLHRGQWPELTLEKFLDDVREFVE